MPKRGELLYRLTGPELPECSDEDVTGLDLESDYQSSGSHSAGRQSKKSPAFILKDTNMMAKPKPKPKQFSLPGMMRLVHSIHHIVRIDSHRNLNCQSASYSIYDCTAGLEWVNIQPVNYEILNESRIRIEIMKSQT